MKRIDTSLIVDPSRLLPLTASVLDKLQENTEDDLSFILISMIGNSFSPSIPYAIYGLTYSGLVNTPTTLNGGYIFYNYKIYVAASWFGGTFTTGATFVLTTANSVPSVQFTDGIFRNVNQSVLAIPTDQTLGAGDFNLNAVVYLQNATPAWFAAAFTAAFASAIANGVTVTPTLLTSFTGATVQYFKDAFGYVHLRGQLTKNQAGGGTTIFMNVAAAYRPTTQKSLSVTNSDNSTLKPDIISIAINGDCFVGNNTAGGAINTIYYLDGLSYYVGW